MAEEEEDQESKTEEASPKKLQEALEKGNVFNSREVNSFLMLFCLTLILIWVLPTILSYAAIKLKFFIEHAGEIKLDRGIVGILIKQGIGTMIVYMSPIFLLTIVVAIFSSYIQHGEFIFSTEQMVPDISKLSVVKGFKRIFSKKSLVEFIKSLLKVLLVGAFLYLILSSDVQALNQYHNFSIQGIISEMLSIVGHLFVCVCIIMAVIAVLDFFYQRFEYYNSLKMTKHEVKEEYKQVEGHPEIKQKMRALRREQSQRRIKQTVPTATVVITNPQHYAVALQYDHMKRGKAPIVVAKGLDLIAQTIKEIASDEGIPIIENPPLARALYKDVNINQEIPAEYYEAVAKIISYVMSMKAKRKI